MNPITYCRRVGHLLTDYHDYVEGYNKDKYLLSEERSNTLLVNGCLPELLGTGTPGIRVTVLPQQVIDYITDTIKGGRDTLEKGGKSDNYEFEVGHFPKHILLLLSNPGLAKLIKLTQPKL